MTRDPKRMADLQDGNLLQKIKNLNVIGLKNRRKIVFGVHLSSESLGVHQNVKVTDHLNQCKPRTAQEPSSARIAHIQTRFFGFGRRCATQEPLPRYLRASPPSPTLCAMALASFLNKVTSNISSLAGSDPQYVVRAFSSQAEMGVDASRSFAKNCFLMAHNAAASKANGFVYFQQELSITELLNMGVRGLNLDVRLDNGTVFLVHGSMNETRAQMAGASPPPALSAFSEVAAWLAAHPSETVLILLESYVPDAQVLPPLLEQSGLALLVFYADGRDGFWNVEEKGWPTVQQMVDAGKRCVILSGAKEDGMPYEYWYAAENHVSYTPILMLSEDIG